MNTADFEWPRRLAPDSPDRESALRELRLIMLKAVRAGLSRGPGTGDDFLEDVVQTAMIRILEHLDRFEGRSAFTTWAIAIALRVTFTELRRKQSTSLVIPTYRRAGKRMPWMR